MSSMTPLQAKFLILGIGLISVKLCLLISVLIIAKQIQRRAAALKKNQQANQEAARDAVEKGSAGVPGPP